MCFARSFVCAAVPLLALVPAAAAQVVTPAAPIAYQPLRIDFAGSETFSETDSTPSPFLDRRLQVVFTAPSGDTYDVPGFFDGDGTGATATSGTGNVWRVRFLPDEPGEWSYAASFVSGPDVAIELADAGTPIDFDGTAGSITVAMPDASAPGNYAKGRLDYVGGFYLRWTNGDSYVKGGTDSPENWLGYTGFDNTFDGGAGPNTPDGLHAFPTHVADWQPGDPDWDRTDPPGSNSGRAIIGAINYLESVGINSIYFLPMNIGGDGKDSWPYIGPIDPSGDAGNDNLRFDISKLAQWEIVFSHAQASGMLLHVVLNEAETPNKRELDNATLGTERKLFYREMVARFAHHNALQWNISEEYNLNLNLGTATVLDFAAFIKSIDPYSKPLTVHNAGNGQNANSGPWTPFLGQADIDLTSLQAARVVDGWDNAVADWRAASTLAGKPIPVMVDEPGSITRDVNSDFDQVRTRMLWDILLSGGGVEWFVNNRDQSLEDFREFDKVWRETTIARTFVETLPINEMQPAKALVTGEDPLHGGAVVFAKPADTYAVFFPDANPTGTIDLSPAAGGATLEWFNPRAGVFEGAPVALVASGSTAIGSPPADVDSDWVALITIDDPGGGDRFTLTVTGGTGSGDYLPGSVVPIVATPPAGEAFTQWIGLPVADYRAASTSLVMPGADALVSAEFTANQSTPALVGLTLIDAQTDEILGELRDGDRIARSELPANVQLTVRADPIFGLPASVVFDRDGAIAVQVENVAPFSLSGDTNGDFAALTPAFADGRNEVAARAFDAGGGGGALLSTVSARFFIADEPCAADLSSASEPGVPDGALTGADFFEFLDRFQAGDLRVDLSSPTDPGVPDGALTGADFFAFLDLFTLGCP